MWVAIWSVGFRSTAYAFWAVNDGIDSEKGPYDMLLPVKNVFNEQYARDISRKVRSAFRHQTEAGGVHRRLRLLRLPQGP